MSAPEVIIFAGVAIACFTPLVVELVQTKRRLARVEREVWKNLKGSVPVPPVHSVMIYVGPGSSITGYRIRRDDDPSHDIVKNHVQVYASPGTYNIALTMEES